VTAVSGNKAANQPGPRKVQRLSLWVIGYHQGTLRPRAGWFHHTGQGWCLAGSWGRAVNSMVWPW